MLIKSEPKSNLKSLEEAGRIQNSETNLRSKCDSILRALTSMLAKKERLDYEIRKQKASLTRKRQELLRVSRGFKSKKKSLRESQIQDDQVGHLEDWLLRYDSQLLQESARILDTD